jgi:hypothetical protein
MFPLSRLDLGMNREGPLYHRGHRGTLRKDKTGLNTKVTKKHEGAKAKSGALHAGPASTPNYFPFVLRVLMFYVSFALRGLLQRQRAVDQGYGVIAERRAGIRGRGDRVSPSRAGCVSRCAV